MSDSIQYPGNELELFSAAINWKQYIRRQTIEFIRGDVLEVGAGIGTTTLVLHDAETTSWTCLEPDPVLAGRIEPAVRQLINKGGESPKVTLGTLSSLDPHQLFDTLIYIDVLEHIEDDRGELEVAAARLRPGGRIVVLVPAHQSLYTPFDRAIGHYRRYDRKSLQVHAPTRCSLRTLRYLDCVGVMASLGNRLLLRQPIPTQAQIALWDRFMVPLSKLVDPLLGYTVGKSLLAVWQKEG